MYPSLLLLVLLAAPPGEKQLSASDWAVVQKPEAGIYDAVVLLDTTSFYDTAIERFRRVRVLSESGKSAAEFRDETGTARSLEGRVVLPDGSETRFNQEDLVETLSFSSRRQKRSNRLLVPPGLTTDCIVELSWTIPAERGLPLKASTYFEAIAEPWHVATKSFTFNKLRSTANVLMVRQLWTTAEPDHFSVDKGSAYSRVTYRDFQAVAEQPFGNEFRHENGHYIYAFRYYSDLNPNPDKYWGELAQKVIRNNLTWLKFAPGSEWDAWVQELKAALPADPVAAMTMVQSQFRRKFALTSLASPEQAARIMRTTKENDIPERILGNVVRRGYGDYYELSIIFFHLVEQLGLPAVLIFPTSLNDLPFNPKAFDDNSFNLYLPLYAIYAKDRPVVFAPVFYEYRAGYYPSRYMGLPALQVDPRSWKSQFIVMPTLSAEANRLVTQYRSTLLQSGELDLSFKRQGTGEYLAYLTRKYFPLPATERSQNLTNTWSSQDMTPTNAAIEGADDLESVVTETLAAKSFNDLSKIGYLVLDPFPHTMRPIDLPAVWPEQREQDLFLPFAQQTIDLNTLTVPEGCRIYGDNDWERTSQIGSVKFKCTQEGTKVTIRRDFVLNRSYYPRELEGQLKEFLAWMDEAFSQTISLDLKGGTP